ncbi:Sec1 like protein [Yasminevirus sp. GU-2018]|uniref:Sec1 like protein n=1 Tax=Yasminevirus sp. GU-2018 TaxID=2420051 RepID=A0A5K0UBK9_9VIRU|nr:Sec1 like protein [Yasminevirus sp. GU-2018]
MAEYLATTLREIFQIELNGRVGYIITDDSTRKLLNRFYSLDQLVLNKVVGVFDIDTMIDYQREDSMTAESKRILRENEMMYIVSLTQNNITHIERQLKHFAMTVRIVFTTPPKDVDLERLARANNAKLIKSIRSFPYDHRMFSDRVILSEELPIGVKTGYRMVFGRVDNGRSLITRRSKFLDSIVDKSEDLFQKCHGKYTTLIISVPREYDVITPFVIPWTYRSMIAYYLRLDHDLVFDKPFDSIDSVASSDSLNESQGTVTEGKLDIKIDTAKIEDAPLFSTNTDIFFGGLKNLAYDVLTDKVSSTVKDLVSKTEKFQALLDSGKLTREMTQDMIKNKKALTSARQHVKVMERLNDYVLKTDAVRMSELQVGILNGSISKSELIATLDDFCKTYHSDLKKNRPLRDVINIGAIVFGIDPDFNEKYGDLIDSFARRFAPSENITSDRYATTQDLIKQSTIESMSSATRIATKSVTQGISSGVSTINKSISTFSSGSTSTSSTSLAKEEKFKFNLTSASKNVSMIDKTAPNPLIAHFPMLATLLIPILDTIFEKDCANFKINPNVADLSKVSKQPTVPSSDSVYKSMNSIENIFIHLNEFITYEEIRFIDRLCEMYDKRNRIRVVLHSEKLD